MALSPRGRDFSQFTFMAELTLREDAPRTVVSCKEEKNADTDASS